MSGVFLVDAPFTMYLRPVYTDRPLVYACSGCASSGQMANFLALKLDRLGMAQMGCLSGIAAGLPKMLAEANTGRPILVIDGCHHACAEHCVQNQGLEIDAHLVLTRLGARKRFHRDFCLDEAETLAETVIEAAAALSEHASVR